MARHHMTPNGKVMFTQEEEDARDAEEAAVEAARPAEAFKALRQVRDSKLAETDYYALSDVTMSDEMKKYRSDLRDLPSKYDNSSVVGDITWPSKP